MPEDRSGRDVLTMPGLATVLRRRAWILVLAALAAGVAAHAIAGDRARSYESDAVLLVGPINAGLDTLRAAGPLAQTYAELARSRPVVAATERRTGVRGLRTRIHTAANETTRLLTIRVRDSDPARAARVANVHAASLVTLSARRASGPIPSGRLQVVDAAVPDRSGVGPDATTIAVLAGLAGLAVAFLLVLLADRAASAIHDGEELELLTGVPYLGTVRRPALPWTRDATPVVERAPRSRAADEYRLLAAKLDALGGRTVAVLSVDGADGGIVAANLAGALTARGARIALVDLDADAVADAPGDAAGNGAHVNGAHANGVHRNGADSHAAGAKDPNATGVALRRANVPAVEEALRGGTKGAEALLRDLLADADVVVLHPPGGAQSAAGLMWARVAEATVLAVQRQRTPRRDVLSAVQGLRLVHARIAGAVLTSRRHA